MAQKMFTLAAVTITTAGSRQAISATPTPTTSVIIEADPTNTGYVYVGDDSVSSSNGSALLPGESLSVDTDVTGHAAEEVYLSDIYVDTATNGNKVRIQYLKRR